MVSFANNFPATPPPLFALGETVMTPGIQELVVDGKLNPSDLLRRHAAGDWGDLDAGDKKLNDEGLRPETLDRLVSSYLVNDRGQRVLVITEYDRSVTTVLLPEEV